MTKFGSKVLFHPLRWINVFVIVVLSNFKNRMGNEEIVSFTGFIHKVYCRV